MVEEGAGSYGVATEVVADSKDMAHEDVSDALIREDGDAEGVVSNLKGSCWSRRVNHCNQIAVPHFVAALP